MSIDPEAVELLHLIRFWVLLISITSYGVFEAEITPAVEFVDVGLTMDIGSCELFWQSSAVVGRGPVKCALQCLPLVFRGWLLSVERPDAGLPSR